MKKLALMAMLLMAAPVGAWAAGSINIRVENAGDLAELSFGLTPHS